MGSKSSMPSPDPRLVDAQINSMGIQDQMIQRLIGNSDAMLPLQQEQLRYGLDAARRGEQASLADREWMLQRRGGLSRIQDQLIDDANTFNTEDRRDQLAGQAIGDVSQAFSAQRGIGARGLSRMGVNPNDGRFASMMTQMDMAEATAKATAANKTREAARQEGMGMKQNAANMLAGYPGMAAGQTGAAAGFGMAGQGLANQGLAGMNSGFGAAGGMAGQMGQNATNMWGQQANAYNQSQANDPFNTILGAAAGVGTKWALGKI